MTATETRTITPPAETPAKPVHVTLPRDMLKRAILAAAKASDRAGTEVPVLSNVLIDVDVDANTVTVVATDRHRLHAVTIAGDPDGRAEYGCDVAYPGRILLSAKEAVMAVKGWRDPNGYSAPYPVTIVGTGVTPASSVVRFEHFEGSREFRPYTDGQFPSWRTLFPSWLDEPEARQNPGAGMVGVNPFYLADALTSAAVAFGDTARRCHTPAVLFTGRDTTGEASPTRPLVVARGGDITGETFEPITYRALIMPVRLGGR